MLISYSYYPYFAYSTHADRQCVDISVKINVKIYKKESYVKIMMWWLTVTVYDMTFTLLSSHYVVCSLSVLSLHLYCIAFVFLPLW